MKDDIIDDYRNFLPYTLPITKAAYGEHRINALAENPDLGAFQLLCTFNNMFAHYLSLHFINPDDAANHEYFFNTAWVFDESFMWIGYASQKFPDAAGRYQAMKTAFFAACEQAKKDLQL